MIDLPGEPLEDLDLQQKLDALVQSIGIANQMVFAGTGSPETVVTAPVGCVFLRRDGGAGTSLYVKESGTGNVGWVGK